MGFLDKLFKKPARPVVTRLPGGTMVIDLRNVPISRVNDATVFDAVRDDLDAGEPPRLRAFVFPAAALLTWSKNAAVMADRMRTLHLATRRRGADDQPIPDAAFVDGELAGTAGAAYLLWSLGLEPFPVGVDGSLPIIEAKTALGRPICGVHGTPIGRKPPDALLRRVHLARDTYETGGDAIQKELELATHELEYIAGVLRDLR